MTQNRGNTLVRQNDRFLNFERLARRPIPLEKGLGARGRWPDALISCDCETAQGEGSGEMELSGHEFTSVS